MASNRHINTGTSADEINALIRDAEPGATLTFAAGNHLLDDGLRIDRSDISLVGAGTQKTTLTFTAEALASNPDTAIHVEGKEESHAGLLETSLEEGDRQLTLDRGQTLEPGDTLRVWQDNDDAFFDAIGDTSWRKVEYAELRTSMARVESVDGNTVTLDRGVHFDFEAGKTNIDRWDTADDVTLEGFGIEFELGEPDPGEFSNTLGNLSRYKAVLLEGTQGANLTDIDVHDGPSTAFRFSKALDLVAEEIKAHGTFNKGGGGNGYAYELHESYDGTLTGLEDSGMRHGLVFASWRSSVGNDAEVVFTDRDINLHGGRDHDNSVRVRESVRDPENDEMSTSLWINQGGESFGAPTDLDANEVTFDYLIGSRRDDVIQGSDGGVYLNGGLGYDTLLGGAGDDILQAGPHNGWGDNYLDGGGGVDIAYFAGDYAEHEIEFAGDEAVITRSGSEDTLVNMEFAVFGDGTRLDLNSETASQAEPITLPIAAGMGENNDEPSEPTETDPETEPSEPTDTEVEAEQPEPTGPETGVELTSNIKSSWSNGFMAEVFVKNLSDQGVQNPQVTFDLAAEIDELWNGQVENVEGSYRVSDTNTGTLEPGETWRFSFKANGDNQTLPDSMTVRTDEGPIDMGTETEQPEPTDTDTDTDQSEPTETDPETEPSEPTDTEVEAEQPEPTDTDIVMTSNIKSSWSTGYVAEVFVENTSDQAIEEPEVIFDLDADIDELWNGLFEDVEGGYQVRGDNQSTLDPGEIWRFSFKSFGEDELPEQRISETNGSESEVQLLGIGDDSTSAILGE